VKFSNYFIQFPESIPKVLEAMMGEKGILSSWNTLASRSAYFLMRFIDKVKS